MDALCLEELLPGMTAAGDGDFVSRDQQLAFKAGRKNKKGDGKKGKARKGKKTGKKQVNANNKSSKGKKRKAANAGEQEEGEGATNWHCVSKTKRNRRVLKAAASAPATSPIKKARKEGEQAAEKGPEAPSAKAKTQPQGRAKAKAQPKATTAKAKAKAHPKSKATRETKAKAKAKAKVEDSKAKGKKPRTPKSVTAPKAPKNSLDVLMVHPLRDDALINELMEFADQFGAEYDEQLSWAKFKADVRSALQPMDLTSTALNIYWTKCSCGVKVITSGHGDDDGSRKKKHVDINHFIFTGVDAISTHKAAMSVRCAFLAVSRLFCLKPSG